MDWFPLFNSLRIAALSCVLVFFGGIAAAYYAARLADARKAGNAPLVVSIKREAAEQGIQLF